MTQSWREQTGSPSPRHAPITPDPSPQVRQTPRQRGLLETALRKQEAPVADEAQFSPINLVEHDRQAPEVGRL